MNMKRFFKIDNTALTLALSILVPYLFFWSNNWHMFGSDELLFSGGALFLGAVLVLLGGTLFKYLIVDIVKFGRRENRLLLVNIVYVAFSVAWLVFLFKSLLPEDIDYYLWFFVIIGVVTSLITLLRLRNALNAFLIVFLCFSVLKLSYAMISDDSESEIITQMQQRRIDSVELQNTPNIYLFILESYHGIEILESVYNFDTTKFKSFLDGNNFVVYPKTYSNSPLTLKSICDIYVIQSYKNIGRGNLDVIQAVRKIIGGNENNKVFKILKNNGYFIENLYLARQGYYLLKQGEYLDKVDMEFSSALDRLSQPLYSINNNVQDKIPKLLFKRRQPSTLTAALDEALAHRPRNVPYFLAIKTGAHHTPNHGYTWVEAEEWVKSGQYQEFMKRSLDVLVPAISRIISEDPGALIAMIGDHGPTRYRNFLPKTFGSDEKIDAQCAESGVTRQDVADDIFNVFLAIRMPEGKQDISYGYHMSHCNLFMHIFSELGRDKHLLDERSPSVSSDGKWTLVKEGKVLDKWLLE